MFDYGHASGDGAVRAAAADALSDDHSRYGVAQALLNKGVLQSRADRFEDALVSFTTVVTLFGTDTGAYMRQNLAPARLNRAKALLRLGRKPLAAAALDEFFRLYPGNSSGMDASALADARQIRKEAGMP